VEKKWFVIYTRAQQELKIAKELSNLGITSYCPTVNLIINYSDRKKKVRKPLLSSYIMVKLNESERNRVFLCTGVVRYLFFLGKPAVVPSSEIELMQNHLNGVYQEIQTTSLSVGQTHMIKQGPFSGHSGEVVQSNKTRVKIELESLGMFITLRKQAA
jgi:transcription antitermination factor NusG